MGYHGQVGPALCSAKFLGQEIWLAARGEEADHIVTYSCETPIIRSKKKGRDNPLAGLHSSVATNWKSHQTFSSPTSLACSNGQHGSSEQGCQHFTNLATVPYLQVATTDNQRTDCTNKRNRQRCRSKCKSPSHHQPGFGSFPADGDQ